jgi:hypothetical protein
LIIDPAKLRDYLLDPNHPRGATKARFFQSLGYSRLAWRRLDADLRRAHSSQIVQLERLTEYGRKFRMVARITGPNGRSAVVVSIWIVRTGESVPRFVTAFPGSAR